MSNYAVLKWLGLAISIIITKARSIVLAMTGNTNFTTPNPKLADITKAIDELEDAEEAVEENGGGKKWTTLRNTKKKALMKHMSQLVAYVNNVANGDADIIVSSAMEIKKKRSPVGILGAVAGVLAKPNGSDGSVKVMWKRLKGAKSYKVLMSADVTPLAWKEFEGNVVTKTRLDVKGLTSGARLWFRVVGINSAGEGAQSDPATVRVP